MDTLKTKLACIY